MAIKINEKGRLALFNGIASSADTSSFFGTTMKIALYPDTVPFPVAANHNGNGTQIPNGYITITNTAFTLTANSSTLVYTGAPNFNGFANGGNGTVAWALFYQGGGTTSTARWVATDSVSVVPGHVVVIPSMTVVNGSVFTGQFALKVGI